MRLYFILEKYTIITTSCKKIRQGFKFGLQEYLPGIFAQMFFMFKFLM